MNMLPTACPACDSWLKTMAAKQPDSQPARQMPRVTSRGFDMTGFRAGRVVRLTLFLRLIPLINFGGGPSLAWALKTWLTHYCAARRSILLILNTALTVKRRCQTLLKRKVSASK